MKRHSIPKGTIIFFLLINTSYFWEGKLGVFAMFSSLILIGVFFILVVALLIEIVKSIQERWSNLNRLIAIGIMIIILSLTILKPKGIIDFDKLEGKDLLIAKKEGGGNCNTRLQLKENKKFIKKSICFGVHEVRGRYELEGDTVYFKNNKDQPIKDFYQYGIIHSKHINGKTFGVISLINSMQNTQNTFLWIEKDNITKKKKN